MTDHFFKSQGHRLPYLMKIALLCIGFLLIIPVSSAETLKVMSNTDRCKYDSVLNIDRCKTVYELCDPFLDMAKVDFRFKTENDKSLKISVADLSYFYSSKASKTDCRVITIEGHKKRAMTNREKYNNIASGKLNIPYFLYIIEHLTKPIIKLVCRKAKYLALNVQTNSANIGFNLVTKYPRAN